VTPAGPCPERDVGIECGIGHLMRGESFSRSALARARGRGMSDNLLTMRGAQTI